MAEIPDINPLKPIWPTRPDERGQPQRERGRDKREPPSDEEPAPPRKPDTDDGHQIDEYV